MKKGLLVLAVLALAASAWAEQPALFGIDAKVHPYQGGGGPSIMDAETLQYHTIFRDLYITYIVHGSNSRLYTGTRFTPRPMTAGTIDSAIVVIWVARAMNPSPTDTLFFFSDTLRADTSFPGGALAGVTWSGNFSGAGAWFLNLDFSSSPFAINGTDFWAGYMGLNRVGTPADSMRACCDTSLNNYNDREVYQINGRAQAGWRWLANAGLPRDWGLSLFASYPSGVEVLTPSGPVSLQPKLYPASPNPFRGTGEIAFDLPKAARVELAIHDLSGRLVRTLVSGDVFQGHHAVRWDGKDALGHPAASGVYLVTLRAGSLSATRSLVVVR